MNVSSVILGETDMFFIRCDDISHKRSVGVQNMFRFHGEERVKPRRYLNFIDTSDRGRVQDVADEILLPMLSIPHGGHQHLHLAPQVSFHMQRR